MILEQQGIYANFGAFDISKAEEDEREGFLGDMWATIVSQGP